MKSQSFKTYAETQIAVYTAMLNFIPTIQRVAKTFEGKVINRKFTTALEAASPVCHIGAPQYVEKDVPMFYCRFSEPDWNGRRQLEIELYYLDGQGVYNFYSNKFYGLEDYNKRIYGTTLWPSDYEELCKRCETVAEQIQKNIAELRDQLKNFDRALAKYNKIYEELKALMPYRSAILNAKEWEHRHAQEVAKILAV